MSEDPSAGPSGGGCDQGLGELPARTFLCDAMLGSLCRWLRFFGFDAEFAGVTDADEVIARRAADEGRWLLTRDRGLATIGPPRTLLIRASRLDGQLAEVCRRFSIRPRPDLDSSRCAECNGVLDDARRSQVKDLIPPYVLETAERFRRCRACGQVYWPGTHAGRIKARLERVVANLYDQRDE